MFVRPIVPFLFASESNKSVSRSVSSRFRFLIAPSFRFIIIIMPIWIWISLRLMNSYNRQNLFFFRPLDVFRFVGIDFSQRNHDTAQKKRKKNFLFFYNPRILFLFFCFGVLWCASFSPRAFSNSNGQKFFALGHHMNVANSKR